MNDAMKFAAFYRDNYSLILSTCMRRLPTRAAAEDVTGEVFRIAWQRYDDVEAPSVSWLYMIARNVVGNEYRRENRARALQERMELGYSAHEPRAPDLREALAQLRPADREILFMAYWEDLTGAEIAQILSISVAAVWVRLNRARGALRAVLELERTQAADDRLTSNG